MNDSDRTLIIDILAAAFKENPRILSMIKKRNPARSLNFLARYAYYIVGKRGTIYLSEDRSTVILYYRKTLYRRSLADNLKYLWTFFMSCRISVLLPALKREKHIESLRKDYDDHIYVWALATKPGHRGLEGLVDIRDHVFGKSKEVDLPILIETTVPRMLNFYHYLGFEDYHHWQDSGGGIDVWFLERPAK